MRIVIAGATGFIGQPLAARLQRAGHTLLALTRDPARARQTLPVGVEPVGWQPGQANADSGLVAVLRGAEGVVNLAGASIGTPRWSATQKRAIRDSRVGATRSLVDAMSKLPPEARPHVLVNASAIGIYGDRGEEVLDERGPLGPDTDFFAGVCRDWEAAAYTAEPLGVRVVTPRLGLVLGAQPPGPLNPLPLVWRVLTGGQLIEAGGVLRPLLLLYAWCLGGPLGSGRQWWSWVHRDDVVGLIQFALEHPDIRGPLNATAPNPVTMNTFGRTLGRVMHRPHWLPAPAFALRTVLGETADALLLSGQRVLPRAAESAGYSFHYPELQPALEAILDRRAP